ncbi:MAG: hypothetical protein SOI56_10120 [Eubacteriales bacterium]|jgi:hypothetical protein
MRKSLYKCPKCGADLKIDLDNVQSYCPYCGCKLPLDMDDLSGVLKEKEHTKQVKYQYDEAGKTRRASIHENARTKRQQNKYDYEERKEKREHWGAVICVLISVSLIFGIPFLFYIQDEVDEQNHINNNEIQVTCSARDLKKETYLEAEKDLKAAGFSNIELMKDEDLITGFITHDGDVESVSIAGDSDFVSGDWFSKNAAVRITYHTFKDDE